MTLLYDDVADAHEISGSGSITLDTVGATCQTNECTFGDWMGVWLKIDGAAFSDGFTLVLNCSTVSGAIVPYIDVYRVSASFNPLAPDFQTFGSGGTIHFLTGPDAFYDGDLLGTQYLSVDFTNPNHASDNDLYYLWCGDWNFTDQGEISIQYNIISATESFGSITGSSGDQAYIEALVTNALDMYVTATIGFTAAEKTALEGSGGHTPALMYLAGLGPQTYIFLRADGNTPGQLEWWLRTNSFGVDNDTFITAASTEADEFHTIDVRRAFNVGVQVRIDGVDFGVLDTTDIASIGTTDLAFGQWTMVLDTDVPGTFYFGSAIAGTGGFGTADVFSDSFSTGAFDSAIWDSTFSSGGTPASWLFLYSDPFFVVPNPPAPPIYSGPAFMPSIRWKWRFVVTDLFGTGLTWLDHWATDRTVTANLNAPWEATGTVPSDSPEINILTPIPFSVLDDQPFLTEGLRLLYGFRREENPGDPPWKCRFGGIIMQMGDSSDGNPATSSYTAWDPWQYLYNLPALDPDTGNFPGPRGLHFYSTPGSLIALEILFAAFQALDTYGVAHIDLPVPYGTGFWETNAVNVIEPTESLTDFVVEQGKSVGEVWDDLVATGTMDIMLRPVYDPMNRPGVTSEISIYARAGQDRPIAPMAWDKPGRSLAGINREIDGTQRANIIRFMRGPGGPPDAQLASVESTDAYWEYWLQQFFPDKPKPGQVALMAQQQLDLRQFGMNTIDVSPAAERSAIPLLEYEPGDRVPVWASNDFRAPLMGAFRVQSIPIAISDNAVESVTGMTVTPDGVLGTPSPFATPEAGTGVSSNQAIQTALTRRRPKGNRGGP